MEFAAAELAPLAGVGIGTIEHKIRDAVDVRHRHPQLWQRTREAAACDAPGADPALAASAVRVWQARKIAYACHAAGLTLAQARWVDAVTTPRLGHCSFGQFCTELEAAIIHVDPPAAAQREQAEAMRRYVTKGQANTHGLSTLVAKVEAGDAVAFLAMVNLLADCLAADGDDSSADVRRSKAVGLVAQPAAALTFLIAHGYGQLGDPDREAQPAQHEHPQPDENQPDHSDHDHDGHHTDPDGSGDGGDDAQPQGRHGGAVTASSDDSAHGGSGIGIRRVRRVRRVRRSGRGVLAARSRSHRTRPGRRARPCGPRGPRPVRRPAGVRRRGHPGGWWRRGGCARAVAVEPSPQPRLPPPAATRPARSLRAAMPRAGACAGRATWCISGSAECG